VRAGAAGAGPGSPAPPGHPPEQDETPEAASPDAATERALAALLFDRDARARWRASPGPHPAPFSALDGAALEEVGRAVVAMVRDRSHRGTGRLADAFPLCVAAWARRHPDDGGLDELHARFLSSPAAAAWREQATGDPGACLEQCFAAFARAEGLADAATVEEELLSALLRALAVTPEPAFVVPGAVRRGKISEKTGWFAISAETERPVLHAASGGRYLRGEITPLIALLLDGASVVEAATRMGCGVPAAAAIRQRLADLGL